MNYVNIHIYIYIYIYIYIHDHNSNNNNINSNNNNTSRHEAYHDRLKRPFDALKAGIFACDSYALYSNQLLEIQPGRGSSGSSGNSVGHGVVTV